MKNGVLKSHSSLISLVNQVIDLLAIPVVFYLVMHLEGVKIPPAEIFVVNSIAIVSFQFLASIRGMYLSHRGEKVYVEVFKCIKYWTVAFLLASFVLDNSFISSGSLAYLSNFSGIWFLGVCFYYIVCRVTVRKTLEFIRVKGFNQRNVVIIGAGKVGLSLADIIQTTPELGLSIAGFYDDVQQDVTLKNNTSLEVVGTLTDLINDVKLMNIDRVYITLSMRHSEKIQLLVRSLADSTCSVILVPDVFAFDLLNSRMTDLKGLPTISIYDTPMVGGHKLMKRLQDVILGTAILLLVSPLLLMIAIAIKLTSKGAVFFKQDRYGIDGKKIKVWKFRSMTVSENSNLVVQATKNDSRITPLGAFLRRTSLDELPQFFNVLQGSMSIVGPRPHAVAHNEEYRKLIQGYMLRHKMKPGITGWAQINGWRGETDTLEKMQKRIEYDLNYIHNWSLLWDLKIVFLTVFKGFVNKNAY